MKYIKIYEDFLPGISYAELEEKKAQYDKYLNKYVIYQYTGHIGYGRVVLLESDFKIWIDVYDINGHLLRCNVFNLEKLDILKSYRTKDEAMEEMKFYRESEKFNL